MPSQDELYQADGNVDEAGVQRLMAKLGALEEKHTALKSRSETGIPGFAVVDVLGHQRLAGYVSVVEIAGAPLLRIDIPADDAAPAETVYQAPASLYALRPCTEQVARLMAAQWRPQPIEEWDLPTALRDKLRALDDAAPRRSRRHRPDEDEPDYDPLEDDDQEPEDLPFE